MMDTATRVKMNAVMSTRAAGRNSRICALLCALLPLAALAQGAKASGSAAGAITGFRNSAAELQLEQQFLAVPSPQLAEEHMRALCSSPHIAGRTSGD